MNRLGAALQLAFSPRTVKMLGLLLAQTFFLWMFFTAGGLERLAELGLISGSPETEVRLLAFEFAARWRHGMAGGWPLYMPGFFVTAVAVWFWVYGLTWQKIVAEYALITALATLVAVLLSPASTGFVVDAFQLQTGLWCVGKDLAITGRVMGQGLFTLLNWSLFVGACQICIVRKSLLPMLLPAGSSLLLVLIRPFTVDKFTTFWFWQILAGEAVAIISALLIPILSVLFVWTLSYAQKPRSLQSRRTAVRN